MKKAIFSLFLFGAMLSAGPVNTVQVTFENAKPVETVPGMGSAEAGPYTLDVNGVWVPAMCMDDFRTVDSTPWTAAVTSVTSSNLSATVLGNGSTSIGNTTITNTQAYEMEAYLFSEIVQPNANRPDLQLAAWSIMDSSTYNMVANGKGSSNADLTAYNDLWGAYNVVTNPHSGFDFGGYEILSDTANCSQEFMVATPEPATCLLFGIGLLVAGAARFSRRRKQAAAL